jgi:hypothetical protein
MAKIKVMPNRESVPPHPIDGALAAEGGYWTADQYTFRLIRDGDITEVVEDPPPEARRAAPDDDPDKRKKPR